MVTKHFTLFTNFGSYWRLVSITVWRYPNLFQVTAFWNVIENLIFPKGLKPEEAIYNMYKKFRAEDNWCCHNNLKQRGVNRPTGQDNNVHPSCLTSLSCWTNRKVATTPSLAWLQLSAYVMPLYGGPPLHTHNFLHTVFPDLYYLLSDKETFCINAATFCSSFCFLSNSAKHTYHQLPINIQTSKLKQQALAFTQPIGSHNLKRANREPSFEEALV